MLFKSFSLITILKALAAGFVVLFIIGRFAFADSVARYKITVNVDVNGHTYSGSSVQEFRYHHQVINIIDTEGWEPIKGEAVVVDVGGLGYFFLLIPRTNYLDAYLGAKDPKTIKQIYRHNKSRQMPFDERIRMVSFHDVNDPKSVFEVTPASLGQAFGENVSLKSILVEQTYERITRGEVEKVIPWVISIQGNLDGIQSAVARYDNLAQKLSKYDFSVGNLK